MRSNPLPRTLCLLLRSSAVRANLPACTLLPLLRSPQQNRDRQGAAPLASTQKSLGVFASLRAKTMRIELLSKDGTITQRPLQISLPLRSSQQSRDRQEADPFATTQKSLGVFASLRAKIKRIEQLSEERATTLRPLQISLPLHTSQRNRDRQGAAPLPSTLGVFARKTTQGAPTC